MKRQKTEALSIYYQAAIAMMVIQLVHKIVREIPGAFNTVSVTGFIAVIVFASILLLGIVLLFFRVRWGLILGVICGAWMVFQPILVHIIMAKPDQNGIWWYPVFPWVQAILIIYFCVLAWKKKGIIVS